MSDRVRLPPLHSTPCFWCGQPATHRRFFHGPTGWFCDDPACEHAWVLSLEMLDHDPNESRPGSDIWPPERKP